MFCLRVHEGKEKKTNKLSKNHQLEDVQETPETLNSYEHLPRRWSILREMRMIRPTDDRVENSILCQPLSLFSSFSGAERLPEWPDAGPVVESYASLCLRRGRVTNVRYVSGDLGQSWLKKPL